MRLVINGYPECPNYNHAIHVAQYLSDKLPFFYFKKVEKCGDEWNVYLGELNKENKWYITKSPLIWKELNMWGGKKYLVGGLSEFWELIWCYYGLESIISKEDLKMLGEDYLKFFLEQEEARHKDRLGTSINLTIMCSTRPEVIFLLETIVNLDFFKARGARVKIYDAFTVRLSKLREYADWINEQRYFPIHDLVRVVEDLEEAVKDCDLLITMYDYKKKNSEDDDEWLNRCLQETHNIANVLNAHAKHNMRVIVNDYGGPVCFIATALIELCPRIRPCDIIAITADEGLSVINAVSKISKVPVSQISAPPVWGFCGVNSFVDERNIIFKAYVYRPYERSLNAPRGTTLPLGTKQSELRMISYLISTQHDQMMKEIYQNKETAEYRLEHSFFLSKLRALQSLLNIWYDDKGSDQIISLGICSNGSFDIPPGLVFSQPVSLNPKKKWVPYKRFPLMNKATKEKIAESVEIGTEICKKFGFMLDQHLSPHMSGISWYTFMDG